MKKLMCVRMVLALLVLCAGTAVADERVVRVLVDQGHNQRFLIEEKGELQLSGFADIIRGSGSQVDATRKPLSDESLKDVTALVISGPFEALRPEEVEAVTRFVEQGGRLAAMLHIGSPLAGLLARLDLDHSNAVLYERRNVIETHNNFRVTELAASPLFAGLEQFSVYGCWALDAGKGAAAIAKTSPEAWADLDGNKSLSKGDAVGSFTVAVSGTFGAGSFVVFGDDALFQNRYLDENNRKLAANLASWLAGR